MARTAAATTEAEKIKATDAEADAEAKAKADAEAKAKVNAETSPKVKLARARAALKAMESDIGDPYAPLREADAARVALLESKQEFEMQHRRNMALALDAKVKAREECDKRRVALDNARAEVARLELEHAAWARAGEVALSRAGAAGN